MGYKEYIVRVYPERTVWYLDGKRHRSDGPAVEYTNGTKHWFQNDVFHRNDGPAIETKFSKAWWKHGKRHRDDGPAIEWADGYKNWYLHGKKLTEKEFLARQQSCEGKVVEVDGKKYKLVEI